MPHTRQNNGVPTTVSAHMEEGDTADQFRDRQIGVLMAHMRHTAAQVAEITVSQRQVTQHMGQLAGEVREVAKALKEHAAASVARTATLEAKLDANTAITEDIARLKTTGQTVAAIIKWGGGIAAALVGFWQLLAAIKGSGGGVGPTP